MKLTNYIAKIITKLALIAAKEASGTASWYGSCQPKEPINLTEYIKDKGTAKGSYVTFHY